MLRTAPPGNPKIVSTPSSFRLSKRISAPVFFKTLPPCALGPVFSEKGLDPIAASEFQFLDFFPFHFFLRHEVQMTVQFRKSAFKFFVLIHMSLQLGVAGDVLLDEFQVALLPRLSSFSKHTH